MARTPCWHKRLRPMSQILAPARTEHRLKVRTGTQDQHAGSNRAAGTIHRAKVLATALRPQPKTVAVQPRSLHAQRPFKPKGPGRFFVGRNCSWGELLINSYPAHHR